MEQSNETQTDVVDTEGLETTVETEAVEQPKRKRAKPLSDAEFIKICNEIALSDDPSIPAIAEATGFTKNSVQGRRFAIGKKYEGTDLLIKLPTGGGGRSKQPELTAEEIAVFAEQTKEATAEKVE